MQKLSGAESLFAPHDRSWVFFAIADVVCGAYVGWFIWRRRRQTTDEPDAPAA